MHNLGWPWPDVEVVWFAAKARRALAGRDDVDRLAKEFVLRLAIYGPVWRAEWRCACRAGLGRPVRSLKGWAQGHSLARLREHVETADDNRYARSKRIHNLAEAEVGWPTGRGDFITVRRSHPSWWDLRRS